MDYDRRNPCPACGYPCSHTDFCDCVLCRACGRLRAQLSSGLCDECSDALDEHENGDETEI